MAPQNAPRFGLASAFRGHFTHEIVAGPMKAESSGWGFDLAAEFGPAILDDPHDRNLLSCPCRHFGN